MQVAFHFSTHMQYMLYFVTYAINKISILKQKIFLGRNNRIPLYTKI